MRLQSLKTSQQFFKYLVLLLALASSPLVYADQEIELADIQRFGKNFLNTKVFFKAIIIDSNECRLESNKGFYCLEVVNTSKSAMDDLLVANGKYNWRNYKNWLDTKAVLYFRGTIEMREGFHFTSGVRSVSPVFIVQEISSLAKN